ncbi:MAG: hypothetical protein OHK0045_24170 [Raineya sp.]
MRLIFAIPLLLGLVLIGSLQAQTIVELEKELSKAVHKDTNWVLLAIRVGDMYADAKDFEKSHKYFQEALKHSQKMKYPNGLIKSYYFMALAYRNEGKYKLSEENHLKAIELAKEKKDENQLMRSYLNIGNTYRNMGIYDKALDSYLKSLEIAQMQKNQRIESANYNNIGEIYRFQANISKALEFYEKALKINREIRDERQVAANLNNIGTIYIRQFQYEKAKSYLTESLAFSEKLNNKRLIMLNSINLGIVVLGKSQDKSSIETAMQYQSKAIEIAEELKDYYNLSIAKRNLARCYMFQKDYEQAEQLVEQAIGIAEKIEAKTEKANGYYDMIIIKVRIRHRSQRFNTHRVQIPFRIGGYSE